MHRLYVEKYESGSNKPQVKYHYYAKVFNEDFNLSFGYPKSDTCPTCEQLKISMDSLPDGSEEKFKTGQDHEYHLRSAEKFYASLRLDTDRAKQQDHIQTISFDFQQNLPLPHLPVGDLFYMQQLWVYVFGVHSCGDNIVAMYCWPETVAKRGSDEVIYCLHHYLSQLPPNVTTLCLYSDGCGGQNKNANVVHYLFTLVATGKFEHITHTFPVRGHSFLPNDRDFGRTEITKRKQERVYTHAQWMAIIARARIRKPFKPVDCKQSMFVSYANHFSQFFKKTVKSSKKKPLNIQKARVLDYATAHASEVWVKYTAEEAEWEKFEILKRGASPTLPVIDCQKYDAVVPVKENKAADLKKIVEKYVPEEFRAYYESSLLASSSATSETDYSE